MIFKYSKNILLDVYALQHFRIILRPFYYLMILGFALHIFNLGDFDDVRKNNKFKRNFNLKFKFHPVIEKVCDRLEVIKLVTPRKRTYLKGYNN